MKRDLLYLLLEISYRLGVLDALLKLKFFIKSTKTIVLMFHRVYDSQTIGLPSIGISVDNYFKLVSIIKKHFTAIDQNEFLDIQKGNLQNIKNPLLITFDDAYEDIYHIAGPELVSNFMPAIVFPVTDALKKKSCFWWDVVYAFLKFARPEDLERISFTSKMPEELIVETEKILGLPWSERKHEISKFIESLKTRTFTVREELSTQYRKCFDEKYTKDRVLARSMDEHQLKQIQKMGITLGAHTVTHDFLTNLSDQAGLFELVESKKELERLSKQPVISLAYPSGYYDEKVMEMAKKAGYKLGFTTKEGHNTGETSPLEIKRVNIWDDFVCDHKGSFSASLTLWRLIVQ